MKKILILGALLSSALPVFSQGRDTAFAVRKLFRERRLRAGGWVATGVSVAADESVGWRAIRSTSENLTAAAVNGGVPLVLGLTQATRFSPDRERAILRRYADGWSIPPDIRRRLRRRHFHVTAHDVAAAQAASSH